jgi:hypothetical protein
MVRDGNGYPILMGKNPIRTWLWRILIHMVILLGHLLYSSDIVGMSMFSLALLSAFRTRGVPGPTSKLSSRAPAQMGRRETEREGGTESRRETGVRGETRGLRVCPAPRSSALAVGGYKRPRGRERAALRERRPVLLRAANPHKRALDLPFIGVRKGSRRTMGV